MPVHQQLGPHWMRSSPSLGLWFWPCVGCRALMSRHKSCSGICAHPMNAAFPLSAKPLRSEKKNVWHNHLINTTCLFMESICFFLVHSYCLCFTHFYSLLLIFTHFYAFLRIFTHFYAYVILLFRRFKKHWEAGFVNKKMQNKNKHRKTLWKKFSCHSSLDHRKHCCTNVSQMKPVLVGLHSILMYFGILLHKVTHNLTWHSANTAIMYYQRRNANKMLPRSMLYRLGFSLFLPWEKTISKYFWMFVLGQTFSFYIWHRMTLWPTKHHWRTANKDINTFMYLYAFLRIFTCF